MTLHVFQGVLPGIDGEPFHTSQSFTIIEVVPRRLMNTCLNYIWKWGYTNVFIFTEVKYGVLPIALTSSLYLCLIDLSRSNLYNQIL